MHFLRSVLASRSEDEGFQVQLVTGSNGSEQKLINTPLNRQDFFKETAQKGIYDLFCANGALFISYSKNHRFNVKTALARINDVANATGTLVSFNKTNVQFDSNGVLLNPSDLIFSGAWANKRIADLLPSNYEPGASEVTTGDTLSIRNIKDDFEVYQESRPVEEIYLHLDKPLYFPGDTVWYKAYLVNAGHALTKHSEVLYVDLIGPDNDILKHEILNVFDGTSAGDVALPAKPAAGRYHIRAYTNWMRNWQATDFFDQPLLIAGARAAKPSTSVLTQPDVQFFPEGGALVDGLRSKVGVKSVGKNGMGEDIDGVVVDDMGNTVSTFKTQHLGMGVFAFTPQHGRHYKVNITAEGKPGFSADLPAALDAGYTLSINNTGKDSIYVKLNANDALLKNKQGSAFYVVARAGDKIYYTTAGRLTAPSFSFGVEKSRFPSGIVQFTLFSSTGEPLNERIAFIQQNDTLNLKLDSISAESKVKQAVKLRLKAADSTGRPVNGSFSVSVINETITGAEEAGESTIFNNLLLTSELKGYIETPNYYFLNPTDQTRADLDVLMLTQGYRRYEWRKMLDKDTGTLAYQAEKSLELTGVLQTDDGKPLPNKKISMANFKLGVFRDTLTDNLGNFTFKRLDLPDSARLLFNAGDNVKVRMRTLEYPPVEQHIYSEALADTGLNDRYQAFRQIRLNDSLHNVRMLKEVTIKERKTAPEPDLSGSANLNGAGHADQIITNDQLSNCLNLSDCLTSRLHGVFFEQGQYYAQKYEADIDVPDMAIILPAMVIIVDGQIMDSAYINNLNAKDVQSVEVLLSGAYLAIYGSNAPFGALVITTKRGPNKKASDISSKLIAYNFDGFYRSKVFYSPRYEPGAPEARRDVRTTVFWEPYLITGKDGKAKADFYNSTMKGTYRVVIEGIDARGNLGRLVYRYKVE
jgi:hypothetical protein